MLRKLAAVVLCGVGVMGIAACGDDNTSSDSSATTSASAPASTTSAPAPTGTPVKVMVIAGIKTQVQSYGEVAAAVQAAVTAINAQGGISGHPAETVICDDHSDPNAAASCARKAVSDKVVAVIGRTLYANNVLPILQTAKIPLLGNSPVSPDDWTNPYSYPLTPATSMIYAAEVFALREIGKTKPAVINLELAASKTAASGAVQAAKTPGGSLATQISIPPTASDYAPFAQKIKSSGADSGALVVPSDNAAPLLVAANQLGVKVSWASSDHQLTPILKQLGPLAEGMLAVSETPPVDAVDAYPGLKQFDAEMAAADDAGVDDAGNTSSAALVAWLATWGMQKVASTVSGDITAASFSTTLAKSPPVDLFGILTWTPSETGPSMYPRIPVSNVWVSTVKDGRIELKDKKPIDIYSSLGLK